MANCTPVGMNNGTHGVLMKEDETVVGTDPRMSKSAEVEQAAGGLLGETGVSVEDVEAYKVNYAAHKVGITARECVAYYDGFAQLYEQNLSPLHYNGPMYAAQTAARYMGACLDARVLDVAAGTGYVGEQLRSRGFTNMDALEPSLAMLRVAESKGIYKRLISDVLAEGKTQLEDDTYDCLLLSGGMGEGHIPCRALTEMVRVVRPGGIVIIVMREEYLDYVVEYVDRLEPFMRELETRGAWKLEERSVVQKYSFGKNGVVFVYRIQQSGVENLASSVL